MAGSRRSLGQPPQPPDAPAVTPEPGELVLAAPPAPADGGSGLAGITQVLGTLVSTALLATLLGSTAGGRWHTVLAGLLGLVAALGLVAVVVDRRRHRARTVTAPRAAYLRHVERVVATLRDSTAAQRRALEHQHPHPLALPCVAEEGSAVWAGGDALLVRYGVSDQPPWLRLVAPADDPLRPTTPRLTEVVARLVSAHAVQRDLPATVDLRAHRHLEVQGPLPGARSVARALVCSAAAALGPLHLAVAVLTEEDGLDEWGWVGWLPHAFSSYAGDLPDGRHLLLVVEGGPPPAELPAAHTVLALPTWPTDDTAVRLLAGGGALVTGTLDRCDVATAEALARRLARRPVTTSSRVPGLLSLLGIDGVDRLDPRTAWRPRPEADLLRVPLGSGEQGQPVHLDLKESALQGLGPHGLVVGATGSGKSELLRTLVLGLALTHAPEQLNLVLVDFKGGAAFAGLAGLPHVAGLITNLADDLALVARMREALDGELVRRQEVLRAAGDVGSARDLARARAAGADVPALPSLLVVVDELSELLAADPELADLFVRLGRLGRSLGVHLLLASQRLEEGRLRGLDAHLSYRIALRTFSAAESRAVLGVPDAFDLPAVPGLAILRCGPDAPVRFRTAYVSGPVPASWSPARPTTDAIVPWTVGEVGATASRPVPPSAPVPERTVLEHVVERLRGLDPGVRRLWLPPLGEPETLDRLMPDVAPDPVLGLVSRHWRAAGPLRLPVGVIDLPRLQRRDVLTVDLTGAGGHVAVVGGPRTGTTTVLQTLVAALALTTTPQETQVYVVDLGGGFAAYAGLPHVAGIGTRLEPDVVRRIVSEVDEIVDRRSSGGEADEHGEVFVVVDGWGLLPPDLDDVADGLQRIATRGLAHRCHLLVAASRWADLRPGLRDALGTRIELRLGDPTDSEIDRRAAALVPRRRPGRGLVEGPSHVLTALPRLDGRTDPASLRTGVADLVSRVAACWPGPAGPRLRLLPALVTPDHLDEPRGSTRLLLGLAEHDLTPVGPDPEHDPHWLVLGEGGSGRSNALRGYLRGLVRTQAADRARVVLVDPRRSLLGEVPTTHLLRHLTTAAQTAPAVAEVAAYLAGRLPDERVTAAELPDRSWWAGPEIFVVVDDHELVAPGQASPLLPLLPLLGQAHDVGLHLVVARHSGGAARAFYEPVLQALRDLATPTLLLSGSPDEGPLVGGVRPVAAPPGRGLWVTRRGSEVVQLAWHPPAG